MLDPTKPDRSFAKWGLVTRSETPVFVSFEGEMLIFNTRQEARDFNHLAFKDAHAVKKIKLSVEVIR